MPGSSSGVLTRQHQQAGGPRYHCFLYIRKDWSSPTDFALESYNLKTRDEKGPNPQWIVAQAVLWTTEPTFPLALVGASSSIMGQEALQGGKHQSSLQKLPLREGPAEGFHPDPSLHGRIINYLSRMPAPHPLDGAWLTAGLPLTEKVLFQAGNALTA